MNISEKNLKFEISNLGSISSLTLDNIQYTLNVPIYPVVFRSHTFKKPINEHFDDNNKIRINSLSPVEFNKKFSDDLDVSYGIFVLENQITFDIKCDNLPSGVNLGFVIPLQGESFFNENEPIFREMCVFNPLYKYPDQQEFKKPVLNFEWESKTVAISAEAKNNLQFFIHKQNKQNCVRVSAESKELKITFLFNYKKTQYEKNDDVESIISKIEDRISQIETNQSQDIDIGYLFNLCRTLRHPGFCWEIDFVKPNQYMSKTLDLIKKIENIAYTSQNSVILKNKFSSEINQAAAFQNIRSHIRAEEGKITDAIFILNQFMKNNYDSLDTCRKANGLFSLSVAFLCDVQFINSLNSYKELWNLMYYCENKKRFTDGVIDAWSVLNLIYAFFVRYSKDFKNFLSTEIKSQSIEIYRHKQTTMVSFFEKDPTPIVSQIGVGFYNHACRKFPLLPKI